MWVGVQMDAERIETPKLKSDLLKQLPCHDDVTQADATYHYHTFSRQRVLRFSVQRKTGGLKFIKCILSIQYIQTNKYRYVSQAIPVLGESHDPQHPTTQNPLDTPSTIDSCLRTGNK
jgi:hypothetical protein